MLRWITRAHFHDELRTDYAAALQKVADVIQAEGTPPGSANMLFVSDGEPNNPNNYGDKVANLRNMQVNLSAFGAGRDTTLYTLKTIDPEATVFTSPAELLAHFVFQSTGSGGGSGLTVPGIADGLWLEPGIAGVIVYVDANNNGRLDWTDSDHDGQLGLPGKASDGP